eukprot:TRINITY_DN7760_c0_g1_i1.p3 TRINITY_DN7760_c0_g1~~TRINITY_DN7760_c0_g1_i1.p3  ORF type:complete len:175 (-),score=60.22 TRINITY_DN7760_c0_g1_i1:26-550(-)
MDLYEVRRREDWYRLSVNQFAVVCGKVVKKGYLVNLLSFWVPEEEWEVERFSLKINKRARQKYLGLKLRELWEQEVILEDYVVEGEDGKMWRCDFFIPGKRIVVEYQGEQHYVGIPIWHSLEGQRRNDNEKRRICQIKGWNLVDVPYWWDGKLDSLSTFMYCTPNEPHTNQLTY